MEKEDIIIIIAAVIYFIISLATLDYYWNKGEEYYQRTHGPGAEETYDVFDDPGSLSAFGLFCPILFLEIGFYKLFCWIKRKTKRRGTREKRK